MVAQPLFGVLYMRMALGTRPLDILAGPYPLTSLADCRDVVHRLRRLRAHIPTVAAEAVDARIALIEQAGLVAAWRAAHLTSPDLVEELRTVMAQLWRDAGREDPMVVSLDLLCHAMEQVSPMAYPLLSDRLLEAFRSGPRLLRQALDPDPIHARSAHVALDNMRLPGELHTDEQIVGRLAARWNTLLRELVPGDAVLVAATILSRTALRLAPTEDATEPALATAELARLVSTGQSWTHAEWVAATSAAIETCLQPLQRTLPQVRPITDAAPALSAETMLLPPSDAPATPATGHDWGSAAIELLARELGDDPTLAAAAVAGARAFLGR
jgi:hypothetical protein